MKYLLDKKPEIDAPLFKVEDGIIEGTGISLDLDPNDKFMSRKIGYLIGRIETTEDGKVYVETSGFVQTHVHSEYSLLDGMSKLKDIADKAKCACALTDHGNTFGILEFQKAMKKAGKHPIFGIEAYAKGIDGDTGRYHLILLVKNEIGLKNLYKLTSASYEEDNFYIKPHVSLEMLKEYHEGLICTSACLGGEVARRFGEGKEDLVVKTARIYHEIFGDDYYIEIQRHGVVHEKEINESLIKLAKSENIKLIAANDSHYINESDGEVHEVLLCINQQKKIDEPHMKFEGSNYYFMDDIEMAELFADIPEAVRSTLEIALKCNAQIETGVYHLPKYVLPEGFKDSWEYLEYLIDKGYKDRYDGTDKDTPDRRERLEYEKGVIKKMGYIDYFLNVWDYVKFAKDNGIMVGPGRGSAAGSIVAYCLRITDLDPIDFDLLFERFLNPDRISMPDIDMDFEDSRRQEVIDYCKRKYGEKRVCNILTLGTMGAKMVIRDVGRVLNMSGRADMLARLVPSEPGITISKAMKINPELLEASQEEGNKEIIRMALRLEGNKRQTGVHACGIVISPDDVCSFIPTCTTYGKDESGRKSDERILVTQVLKDEVEEMGLLKCDFLGLSTMSVLGESVREINKIRKKTGEKLIEDYREIPLNDTEVYKYIARGNSKAIFQIESPGMGSFMEQLFADVIPRLNKLEELEEGEKQKKKLMMGNEFFDRMIAGISLYRPGPMDYIPEYIENMLNPDNIKYDTPSLEPILKATYGVIVYQEQVMEICRKLAGFTMGQADTIRKAMGKKKQDILDQFKPYFIYGSGDDLDNHTGEPYNIPGCVALNISEDVAKVIWDKMADFAKYAFNKSHAAVYAVLTISSAWVKYYYPAVYMCAMMNTFIASQKLKEYISVTKKMGIKILQPDVNESDYLFKVVSDDEIRFGLFGLANVGSELTKSIVKVREEHGAYKDVEDFIEKMVYAGGATRKMMESLIYSGAFDFTDGSRQAKLIVVDRILDNAKSKKADILSGQMSLFDMGFLDETEIQKSKVPIPNLPELPKREKLEMEKKYAGFYVTEHPLDAYEDIISKSDIIEAAQFTDEDGNILVEHDKDIKIAGIVNKCRTIYTKKNGDPMKIFSLEDRTGEIDCVIFTKMYQVYGNLIEDGNLLCVKGKFSLRDDKGQVIVNSCCKLDDFSIDFENTAKIYLKAETRYDINKFRQVAARLKKGDIPVIVQYDKKLYALDEYVNAEFESYMELLNVAGENNIIFK